MPTARRIVHAAHGEREFAVQRLTRPLAGIDHMHLHERQRVVRALLGPFAVARDDGVGDEANVEPPLHDGSKHRVHDKRTVAVDDRDDSEGSGGRVQRIDRN